MAALAGLMGDKLLNGKGEDVNVSEFAGEGKVFGIYFSAHWCPPCRTFTPQLAEWYKKFKQGANGDKFEIVFVSSDRDEKSFKEYFAEMPWHALSYDQREKKGEISRKFKVSGIPTLVFLNAENAQLITADGRSIVMEDPEGKEFPWTPKPFSEIIKGKFIDKAKKETTWDQLEGKVIGLYFSAHWCGPCRGFTPELVNTYNKLQEDKNFEIIFCSSDRDEDAMMEYLGEMPWLAIPFGDPRKKALSRFFDISGIPTLVILNDKSEVITTKGRSVVSGDKEGKDFPWYPKPVNELTSDTASDINDCASLICFTEDSGENTTKVVLTPIAEEYIAKWKEAGKDQKLLFFYTGENEDEIKSSLRQFAQFPATNPLLGIVDIPNQKSFVSEAKEVTDATVREFIEGFLNGTISGKPLGTS